MKKNIKEKNIIAKCGADVFTPLALVFGFYVILHGHLSPGGGFQGGVLIGAAIILLYLAYGHEVVSKVFHNEFIRKNEAVGAVCYTFVALLGIFGGYNFCRNVLYDFGNVGDLISSGTIMFMNWSVGYKVLTGVGFLLLMMLGLLSSDDDEDEDEQ